MPLAEAMLQPGDALLVKGSRSVGLELRHRRADRPAGHGRAMSPPLAALASDVASSAIDRGQILIAGMAAMLITIFLGPKFIEFLRAREFGQQIREEGPAEHQAKAGTPTMGGLIVFVAIAVPYLVLSAARHREPGGVRRRARRRRRSASPTTSSRSPSAARSACRRAGSCWSRSGWRSALWWVAHDQVGLDPRLQVRIFDATIYLGPVLYVLVVFLVIAGASNAVNLTDGLDGLAAGSCAIVLLAYTAITITSGQEGLALLSACLVGRLGRLPVVQLVSGGDLHGRHRVAGAGRGDRRAGGDDPDGAAADHPRRDLRDRGALGGDSGRSASRCSAAGCC